MKFLSALFIMILVSAVNLSAQTGGTIKGVVIDEETKGPIESAVVELMNTGEKKGTDAKGEFSFTDLDNNITYRIKISSIGYEPIIKSDLVLYTGKPLELVIKLRPKGILTDVIDVNANFFEKQSDVNISSINLDYEEIRRAPGATEDISRMLQTSPGVSIGNDQRNDLIVRGGSPSENLILIDGIEIPNMNHFGTQGSSSGAISFINSKFIFDAEMLTGGFPSPYGDRLSSVVDITFREGSREKIYGDVNLSLQGFGGILEGPLTEKGSYLVSVRRSYLELIESSLRLTSVPNYWDGNLKVNYEITPSDKLILIGFMGLDKVSFSNDVEDDNPFGKSDVNQKTYATGLNYTHLFGSGYLQTVLSTNFNDYNITQYYIGADDELRFDSRSLENETTLKTDLNYTLSRNLTLNTGAGAELVHINNQIYLAGDTSYAGYVYDTINAKADEITYKLFTHVNLTHRLFKDKLILNTGLRYDYFDFIRLKSTISPRLGLSYKITPVTSINAAYGIFYQTPEYIWLVSAPGNENLNSIRSDHYILGIEHFFASDLRATVEIYEKRYKDYPVWKDVPTYILIDGGSDFGPNLVGAAVSAGTGYIRGIDISLHKKLSVNGLYGMLNYSYSFSRFTALEGGAKPGAFDPQNQFTLIAGYQFKSDWLFGFKVKYAGGRPYTPIDIEASTQINRGVYATDDFNSARYPYYMRVDVRVDKKFNFKNSSIVAYIELQNLFNRDNIYSYFWNEGDNELGTIYQWAFFPVGGVSVQF